MAKRSRAIREGAAFVEQSFDSESLLPNQEFLLNWPLQSLDSR